MKLSISSLLSLPFFYISAAAESHDGHEHDHDHGSCTHGKLFVSDAVDGNIIHVIDVNPEKTLAVESTVAISGGPKSNDLYVSDNNQVIASLFYGTEESNYTDGVVNWVHTGAGVLENGTLSYDTPVVLPNAAFGCVTPLHFSANGDMISIFCDGNYDINSNTTIWVIDETKLNTMSTDESAILYNTTIPSSHHGNSVPMGDSNLFYSLATPDRVSRTVNGTDDELAYTFQVTDFSGNVVHSVADTSDTSMYCAEHHGIANTHDTVILACDENHGGVLMVTYDQGSNAYTSRALSYPPGAEGHRSFHFEQHKNASHFIGDLQVYDAAANELSSFHLFAFSTEDDALTESNILKLPSDKYPCAFGYERSEGEIVLVFLANGMLYAYEFVSNWTEIASLQVVENMENCTQAVFAPGYVQGFVMTTAKGNGTIYSIDLDAIHTDGMKIHATAPIDFVPYKGVVAGVPSSLGCVSSASSEHGDDHETGDGSGDDKTSTSAAVTTVSTVVVAVMGIVSVIVTTGMIQ